MFKKNNLIIAIVLGAVISSTIVSAEPVVELAAPRMQPPKVLQDVNAPLKNVSEHPAKIDNKTKKQKVKRLKRYIHKKAPIKVDYGKVSKLIEYGYYDYADGILQGAMARNSKDVKAQSLWVISLAKQCKLDPAQDELNVLLKKYPDNSDLHYAQGIVYYQRTTSSNMAYRNNTQALLNDAMKEFKKAIDLDKSNAKAYNAAGVISIRQDKNKDAVTYFKKALEVDKAYSMAIDNLGTVDFAKGKFKEAEKKFNEALSYNTQNTTAMYHLAQVAMRKQDYATALNYLNDALALNSNSPAIYNLMGKAYVAQGNEAAAVNAFRQSIVVKPEFTLSYSDLADVYQKRGDSEFAIEQLKTVLTIDPTDNIAKLKIADISLASGKYKQAIEVYSELVGIDKYNSAALKGLADAYYAQAQVCSSKSVISPNKDLFTAMDCINKAMDASSKAGNPDLELYLAKLKLEKITNQPALSKVALQKIISSQSNDLLSTVVKGNAYLTLNDYANAEKTFNYATTLSQNTDDDLCLSKILIYHKQLDSAEKVLQKILKADSQNQQALSDMAYIQKNIKYSQNYFDSAKCFLKSGNKSAAIEYFNRSLSINPNNAQAHLLLAQLYEKQKDYTNAIVHYAAYSSLVPNASDSAKIGKKIKRLDNKL